MSIHYKTPSLLPWHHERIKECLYAIYFNQYRQQEQFHQQEIVFVRCQYHP